MNQARESLEKGPRPYWNPYLSGVLLGLVLLASFLTLGAGLGASGGIARIGASALMKEVEAAEDHIEPEELADRLMAGEPGLVVVDVRPAAEFGVFHIRGAINVPLPELAEALRAHRNTGTIVLYSNGMTHPAQARDSLRRQGFANVYLLTDGLQGFRDRCLKPVSLRPEPLSAGAAARVNAWRAFFAAPAIVLVPGDKFHDATLAAIALERLGHTKYSVLNGGYAGWTGENRPVSAALPQVARSQYPVKNAKDS